MEDFHHLIGNLAADGPYAIALSARSIAQTPQEFRAFRRQGKRDRDHELLVRCLQKATKETKAVIGLATLRYLLLGASVRSVQSRRADSSTICTTKLFFSAAAGLVAVAGGSDAEPPIIDAI